MLTTKPIPLKAIRTAPSEPEYQALLAWPFAAQPFYEGQVLRLLQNDIPYRVMYNFGMVWVYRDPAGNTVGFGTLDVCKEYALFAGGKYHSYIPLLAVDPAFQKRGHGRSIVEHLIAEAALLAGSPADLSDRLFLDVYTANQGAISLYEKCGFVTLNPDAPIRTRKRTMKRTSIWQGAWLSPVGDAECARIRIDCHFGQSQFGRMPLVVEEDESACPGCRRSAANRRGRALPSGSVRAKEARSRQREPDTTQWGPVAESWWPSERGWRPTSSEIVYVCIYQRQAENRGGS